MRMSTKKVMGILLILIVAGSAVLFADAVADAYRDGYLKGYSTPSGRPDYYATNAGYSVSGTGTERAEKQRLRDSYLAGFQQGREDKANKKENRYL